MIKSAMEYIGKLKRNEVVTAGGKEFVLPEYNEVNTLEPKASPLKISTLTGLVTYIKDGIDSSLITGGSFLHVNSFKSVSLVSPLFGENKQRETFLTAEYDFSENENFSNWTNTENFIINVNSMFEHTNDFDYLMQVVSGLSSDASKELKDTGMAQTVTVKTGVTTVGEMEVKNPITLQPFKTFSEIKQPEIKYVFRMKSDRNDASPLCALFSCDGGLWKLNTIHAIKDFLTKELSGIDINIIA